MTRYTRRRALLMGVCAASGLAGCTGGNATPTRTEEGESAATDDASLDLREANVVGVETERRDGRVSFGVTLHHDDDGEDGYANWWQIESLGGGRLGRRELTHPHSTQPFRRSGAYEIPADTTCVVVRGHDETHGYGGRAMLVDVDSGATRAFPQGPSRQSPTERDCP